MMIFPLFAILFEVFKCRSWGIQTISRSPEPISWGQHALSGPVDASSCEWIVTQGYLKQHCLVEGLWYFKCPFSDEYYRVTDEKCSLLSFTRLCRNDTTFYQVCGHFHDIRGSTCDDGLDDVCVQVGVDSTCRVHKHRLCDQVADCPEAKDEKSLVCDRMTDIDVVCVRKQPYVKTALPLPVSWVFDGIEDCIDGIDEKEDLWSLKCGTGTITEYLDLNTTNDCAGVSLMCPNRDRALLLPNTCQDQKNCDFELCKVARNRITPPSRRDELLYCMKGLKRLEQLAGKCESMLLKESTVTAAEHTAYLLPKSFMRNVNCQDVFGNSYIRMACSNTCREHAICPIRVNQPTAKSCINFRSSDKAISVTLEGTLTVLKKDKGGVYRQDFFACDNLKCVPLDHTCDLDDDCGSVAMVQMRSTAPTVLSAQFRANSSTF